jgi:predicted amidophosphoribosyltransferase
MASGTEVESGPRRWRQAAQRCGWPGGMPGLGAVGRAVQDVVFPPMCVSCRTVIDADRSAGPGVRLCRRCVDELELIGGPTCRQCGAPVPDAVGAVGHCIRCGRRKFWFDETIALGHYAGRLRQMLLAMKQASGNPTSLAVAELIWQRCGERLQAAGPGLVVPIPIHWRRRWWRGTSSASLLAESLAGQLRVPLGRHVLRRRRNTPPQFSLPPSRRWSNVRRAFFVKGGYPLAGMHVLLVDDILTTGATCSAAAGALKRAGAARVTVAVAARTFVA